MNQNIQDLVRLSQYAGERIDIVQAGGGNSSVKDGSTLWVKASGFTLSDLTAEKGIATVDQLKVASLFDRELPVEKRALELMGSEVITEAHLEGPRPSIETFLHAITGRVTLHTHPIVVNLLVASQGWESVARELFPQAALVPYRTPGLELGVAFTKEVKLLNDKGIDPKIALFKNHGLLVSGETVDEVIRHHEAVLEVLEKHYQLDLRDYRSGSAVSALIRETTGAPWIAWRSQNQDLQRLWGAEKVHLKQRPLFPDQMVFNGYQPLELKNIQDVAAVTEFQGKFGSPPKVIVLDDALYFLAPNLKKAKEMEDVLLSQLFVFSKIPSDNLDFLPQAELSYLDNWESEKYRQGI